MKVKNALAALPLVLNACGGEESSGDFTPNEPGFGIWEGGFSANSIAASGPSGSIPSEELDQVESQGIGLYTSNNRVFFYKEDDRTLFTRALSGITTIGSTHNLVYSPDIYRDGNLIGTVDFDGNPYISTSITGRYEGSISGYYGMQFNSKYSSGANLSVLEGNWLYAGPTFNWNLIILANGDFSGTSSIDASCSINGKFTMIENSSKNEYAIDNVQLSNCAGRDGTYKGLAAIIDSDTGVNDIIIMAIYNFDNGFFMKPVKQP